MSKKKSSFGESAQEVDSNIVSLEQERKSLAEKLNSGNLSSRENKRFDEIGDKLVEANEFRTTFQNIPGEERPPATFDIDKKTVIGDSGPGALINPNRQSPINLGGNDPFQVEAPASSVEDPSKQIVNQTLQGINRGPSEGGLTQDINTATFGGLPPAKQPGTPLIEQGARTTLGINDPILKGNVSGSMIGNQPIFVGGGDFMAMDVINNRQKAIQDAAAKRQADTQALLSQKPKMIKDQAFQKSLNDKFYSTRDSFIAQAQEENGANWDMVLKDQTNPLGRQFVQSMDNFDFVAEASDQVTDAIAVVDADLKSGKQIFSDKTLEVLENYKSLQGQFANGDVNGQISLREEFETLEGFKGLDLILKDDAIKIKGTVTQYASILEDSDKYVTTTQKKTAYEDQLKVISKDIAENQMRSPVAKGLISEDEIFEHMNALYGYESITKKSIKTKPSPSGGIKVNVDLGNKFEGEKIEKIQGKTYTVGQSFEMPTGNKSLEASGLVFYDPTTGLQTQENGIKY